MAKKPKKKKEPAPKKCKQCGVGECVELWLICAACSAKNTEYARKIDRDRLDSPSRWTAYEKVIVTQPARRQPRKNKA